MNTMKITDTTYQGTHSRAEVIRLAQEAEGEALVALEDAKRRHKGAAKLQADFDLTSRQAESLIAAARNPMFSGCGWVTFSD